MERCTLCGGKLANGRCTECGLDNTKNDKKYRLNAHNEKESRFHSGDCEDNLNQNCDSSKAWGRAGAGGSRSFGKDAAGSGQTGSAAGSGQTGSAMSRARRAKVLKERSKTGTVKKKSGFSRLVFWIVLLVILFELFGNVLMDMFSESGSSEGVFGSLMDKLTTITGEDDSDWPEDWQAEEAAVEEVSGEKPGEIVWNEQSPGYFEEGLTMGIYTVGYEIPAGVYQMFCDTGTAWLYLYDAEADESEFFALYSPESQESYAESFGECDYYELSGELKLQEGDVIYVEECDEGVFIKGQGDGEDSLKQHEPQKLPGTVAARDGMEAGTDFEPGVYTVTLGELPDDEYGSAYLRVTSGEDDSYYISLHQAMPVFYRFPFQEGDSIELTCYGTETEVTLTPSY